MNPMIEVLVLVGLAVTVGLLARSVQNKETRMNVMVYYRTQDGLADYEFSLEEQRDGSWRAYIVSQPSYGSRETGAHATHRLTDGGRYYVCWSVPLWSKADVQRVAAQWADWTQVYIKTGTPPGGAWIAAWRPRF